MLNVQFKSLRTRLAALLISPVVLILLAAGAAGFIYARNIMLAQWNQSVTQQLERAAHEIEMNLTRPLELMKLFAQSGSASPEAGLLEAIVQKLETMASVVRVNLNWHTLAESHRSAMSHHRGPGMGRFMRFHRGTFATIRPPVVDETIGGQTVTLTMVLMDASDTPVGNLEIVLLFDELVAGITANVWWQNARACIADRASGQMVLTSGLMRDRHQLGENDDDLELALKREIAEKSVGTLWGAGIPPERVAGFHSLQTFPWSLVVFADGRAILAPIITFRNGFVLGAMLIILTIYTVIRLNVDRVAQTIRHFSDRAGKIAAGDYKEKIAVAGQDEIGQLAISFNAMIDGLQERDTIRNTFGRYVDPEFARALLKQPETGHLGGRRREVAILMADIRGFTPMTEAMSPEATIDVLNRYFSVVIPLIQRDQGIIVDFVGDGILAFFEPVEEPLARAAQRCVRCAFDMQAAMDDLNRLPARQEAPPIDMGIGINCGPVVVGNIGSEARKKYGIVGSSVNLTQRIQGQAEGREVVVSQPVIDTLGSSVRITRTFTATLKGVASTVHLYAIAPQDEPPSTTTAGG